ADLVLEQRRPLAARPRLEQRLVQAAAPARAVAIEQRQAQSRGELRRELPDARLRLDLLPAVFIYRRRRIRVSIRLARAVENLLAGDVDQRREKVAREQRELLGQQDVDRARALGIALAIGRAR